MSLVDQLESGYKSGEFNTAPVYVGAVWKAKLVFATAEIVGLTHEVYFVRDEFSEQRLFDCVIVEEIVDANTEFKITGTMVGTEMLRGCSQAMVKHVITETATGEKYPYYQKIVSVESGVVDA